MKNLNCNKAIIAIGNCAREDDGLGWAFAEKLETEELFDGDIIYKYQLQIEDAELISQYDCVYFVDASRNQFSRGFDWQDLIPNNEFVLTTHALDPQTILYLAEFLFNKKPSAKLLQISGSHWNLKIGLSTEGINNLAKALSFWKKEMVKRTSPVTPQQIEF